MVVLITFQFLLLIASPLSISLSPYWGAIYLSGECVRVVSVPWFVLSRPSPGITPSLAFSQIGASDGGYSFSLFSHLYLPRSAFTVPMHRRDSEVCGFVWKQRLPASLLPYCLVLFMSFTRVSVLSGHALASLSAMQAFNLFIAESF